MAAVAWSALFASPEPIHKNGGTRQHYKHYSTEAQTLNFCNALLMIECLTCLSRRALMPILPCSVQRSTVQRTHLSQRDSQDQFDEE